MNSNFIISNIYLFFLSKITIIKILYHKNILLSYFKQNNYNEKSTLKIIYIYLLSNKIILIENPYKKSI